MPQVNGYELVCPVCRGKDFTKRSSLLNTRGMTFFNLDWTNQGATNYICKSCGYIFWFIDDGKEFLEKLTEKKQIGQENFTIDYETTKAEEDECPVCFRLHDKCQKECPNCGHRFE